MLTAAVIYVPGSGGSFLRRALCLSDDAIFEHADVAVSALDKFHCYNNWNTNDWKSTERLFRPLYRTGVQEFCDFEKSALRLIDAFHPEEFWNHEQNQIAWLENAWPNLIFISVNPSRRNFLENNQGTKNYSVNFDLEHLYWQQLFDRYDGAKYLLDFEQLLSWQDFSVWVNNIDQHLELGLRFDLVQQLWASWFECSSRIWRQ